MERIFYVYQRVNVVTGKVSNFRYGADHKVKIGKKFKAGGNTYKVIRCRKMKPDEIGVIWI